MYPYLPNDIEYFSLQNIAVIYHNMIHTYVTNSVIIQQILHKAAYP